MEPKQKSGSHSTGGGAGRVTFHSITDFQKPRLVHPTLILEIKRPGLGEDSLSQQPQSDIEARIAANLRPPSSAPCSGVCVSCGLWCDTTGATSWDPHIVFFFARIRVHAWFSTPEFEF